MSKVKRDMKNSKYTQEFRDSTIQLVMNSNQSVLQIGKDLDVNPKTIYNWVRSYKIANNIPIDPIGTSTVGIVKNSVKETQNDILKRLRAENKLLKQERDILKKSSILCQGSSIKYAWIKENTKSFQVSVMCKILKVDRTSYYHWVKNGCIVKRVDEKLNELIEVIFEQGRGNHGTRRVKKALVERYGFIS